MVNAYKVALIGGTGKVGRYIASKAVAKGYQVRMLVRNPEKVIDKDSRIEIVKGNVKNVEDIRKLLKDCQVVINTFGQPIKEKAMYSSITKNILDVMTELHIDRYIGVTGGSLTITGDHKSTLNRIGAALFKIMYSNMMGDKKKEWDILTNHPHIQWTLIRLPFIVDGAERGNLKEHLTDMPGTKITNQDIATFIIHQIDNLNYVHKAPFIAN
ncbi:NAD(P)-dependent oxidoreductase [Lysinibacillus varians]|uniref:NAD-dependent epimerase/dehydratase family protein n=1 Tax=Lysinibacillus varians TaxID=1145276 RepID=A0ABY2TB76_9BACI|nr:NAD(P)H-binding protein [Lysinibacillus varians]AHN22347.1 NADH-flavin reductase [Lysinibacillus varians]TKI65006.1 NAD-dependent epimerase/dehydratase family protein [Lysinibacillus varians]